MAPIPPSRNARTPRYRRQRRPDGTDLAFVQIGGRRHYLGTFDSTESREKYHRLIAEWEAGGRPALVLTKNADTQVTVAHVILEFWRHAKQHYRHRDGSPTSELDNLRQAIRPLRELYGSVPAESFGPKALKTVRQRMIEMGWCRTNINKQVSRLKSIIRWAAEEELVSGSLYHGLLAVRGLSKGRSTAKESVPVKPVPESAIEATLAHLSRQVRAMIELQLLTGARSDELTRLRPVDIDMTGRVWIARLEEHKTAHHGIAKTIFIGPKAQEIVRPFLVDRMTKAYLFSPQEAETERRATLHRNRKTPLSCGNRPGSNRQDEPKRCPSDRYTTDSYRRAIHRACDQANVPRWSPHRLRHNAATRLRAEHGIDIAQTILGHRIGSRVTEIYAEANLEKARAVMALVG